MKILLASSEVFPFSKTGGLADMVGALAKALGRAGHQVGLVTPLDSGIQGRDEADLVPCSAERLCQSADHVRQPASLRKRKYFAAGQEDFHSELRARSEERRVGKECSSERVME